MPYLRILGAISVGSLVALIIWCRHSAKVLEQDAEEEDDEEEAKEDRKAAKKVRAVTLMMVVGCGLFPAIWLLISKVRM